MAEALRAAPDLCGFNSMGAGNRGVVAAPVAAGRGADVIAVGHELTPFMREVLLSGTIEACIDRDPADEVRRVAQTLKALADGQHGFRPDPVCIDIDPKDNLP